MKSSRLLFHSGEGWRKSEDATNLQNGYWKPCNVIRESNIVGEFVLTHAGVVADYSSGLMAPDSQRQSISTARNNRQSGSIRRRSSASGHRGVIISESHDGIQNLVSSEQSQSVSKFRRFRIHPFRGMWKDIHRRLPYYPSDWTDAWTYRVIPSTIDMYFKKYSILGDQI